MILKKITITNFRSVNGTIELDADQNVTILLGANDHGKSNILAAIQCLNAETPISEDDVNWDASTSSCLVFDLGLSEEDSLTLKTAINTAFPPIVPAVIEIPEGTGSDEQQQEPESASVITANGPAVAEIDDSEDDSPSVDPQVIDRRMRAALSILSTPSPTVTLMRTGPATPLTFRGIPLASLPVQVQTALTQIIPRVELFLAFSGELQDSVTAAQIKTDTFEFLQGVFFYAGIDPMSADDLFTHNDQTERKLDEASHKLDAELRRIWAQGVDLNLHFELRHRQGAIEFLANDPAVKTRKARMSKRSTGVTQFFRLSMLLNARRKKHPANSYMYLFDEPGVFLHPKGQKDLIQVFEQISGEAQVVYATHSLFMLNQNFPERHRLIIRDAIGTRVDQKPYRANWRLATDALGVYLTAGILFSPTVLLVEGDSDPLYLYEMFRQLNRAGMLDADTNMLGILSYGDLPNLRFLLQMFKPENKESIVAVLCDGDVTGKKISEGVKSLCERLTVPRLMLQSGKAMEDYVIRKPAFLAAVEDTLRMACEAEQQPIPEDLKDRIQKAWTVHEASTTQNAGKWFKDFSKELLLKKGEASKVALARNYAFRCRAEEQQEYDAVQGTAALEICKEIAAKLGLPSIKAKQVVEA